MKTIKLKVNFAHHVIQFGFTGSKGKLCLAMGGTSRTILCLTSEATQKVTISRVLCEGEYTRDDNETIPIQILNRKFLRSFANQFAKKLAVRSNRGLEIVAAGKFHKTMCVTMQFHCDQDIYNEKISKSCLETVHICIKKYTCNLRAVKL